MGAIESKGISLTIPTFRKKDFPGLHYEWARKGTDLVTHWSADMGPESERILGDVLKTHFPAGTDLEYVPEMNSWAAIYVPQLEMSGDTYWEETLPNRVSELFFQAWTNFQTRD